MWWGIFFGSFIAAGAATIWAANKLYDVRQQKHEQEKSVPKTTWFDRGVFGRDR